MCFFCVVASRSSAIQAGSSCHLGARRVWVLVHRYGPPHARIALAGCAQAGSVHMHVLQVLEQAWACLLQAHQHGNVRPHCQLFLVALLCQFPVGVESHLLPALSDFSAATSYQVQCFCVPSALCSSIQISCYAHKVGAGFGSSDACFSYSSLAHPCDLK